MSNIKSITPVGKHQTYDLEVDHPNHQFYLANGVLTSNSHAVAYSIDSFWTAWLMTYHEEQWLSAYIESMLSSPEKKAKAFGEVRRLGYTIVPIDINYAGTGWTVLPGKRLMPSLLSCTGIGETAAKEIIDSRPYTSIENMLYNDDGSWRPSKFNKKALEVLIKIGAFASFDCVGEGKLFESYKLMHEVLIENSDLVRKSPVKDRFLGMKTMIELAKALGPCPEWTRRERAEMSVEVFGNLDVSVLIDPDVIARLDARNVRPIDEWDGKDLYWFCLQGTKPKRTRNGKQYLVLETVGYSGESHKINAWGWNGERTLEQYSLVVAELDRNDFGFSTTMWKCKEVIS